MCGTIAQVVAAAPDAIHAHEVVLTLGLSTTTLRFLLKAAERRSFQVRLRCCAMLRVLCSARVCTVQFLSRMSPKLGRMC